MLLITWKFNIVFAACFNSGFEDHPLVQKMKKEKTEHRTSWSKNFRKKSDNLKNSLKGKEIAR